MLILVEAHYLCSVKIKPLLQSRLLTVTSLLGSEKVTVSHINVYCILSDDGHILRAKPDRKREVVLYWKYSILFA